MKLTNNEHEGAILLEKAEQEYFYKVLFYFLGERKDLSSFVPARYAIHFQPMPLAQTKINLLAVVVLYLQLWIRGRQINWLASVCQIFAVWTNGTNCCKGYKVLFKQNLNATLKCTATLRYCIYTYFKWRCNSTFINLILRDQVRC